MKIRMTWRNYHPQEEPGRPVFIGGAGEPLAVGDCSELLDEALHRILAEIHPGQHLVVTFAVQEEGN